MIFQPGLTWDARQDLQVLAGMDIPEGGMSTEFGGVMEGRAGLAYDPLSLIV